MVVLQLKKLQNQHVRKQSCRTVPQMEKKETEKGERKGEEKVEVESSAPSETASEVPEGYGLAPVSVPPAGAWPGALLSYEELCKCATTPKGLTQNHEHACELHQLP